ncbi:MAG: C-GCAxxG-C-C family protein [Bacteroidota bacterium]
MTNNESLIYARSLFDNGYNCAQSVVIAVFARFGEKEDIPRKMASGFGGGIAGEKEICGALSGSVMALGWFVADKDEKNTAINDYISAFRRRFGHARCADLIDGIPLPLRHKHCADFVEFSLEWCVNKLEELHYSK